MDKIEKIRQEIERLKKLLEKSTYYLDNSQQALGYSFALDDFNEFLDTLSEQPDKSLEEAAIDFADNARRQLFTKDYAISSIADYDHGCIDGFKAGAEWQESQMMKEAVEGFIYQVEDYYPKELIAEYRGDDLKHGDKVRIIIVKEENK